MDFLYKIAPALIVALFMFYMNRVQTKRDKAAEAHKKELAEKEDKHLGSHNLLTKGMWLQIESNRLALESLKKLKDERGKALLNGELTAINRKINEFKTEFENHLIEK